VQIRPARPADAQAIDQIVQRAYGPYVAQIGLRPAPMDVDYGEKIGAADVFVAVDLEVVGALVLAVMEDHVLIENVAVDPGRQGEGIGADLLAFAESWAEETGRRTVRLYTNVAMTRNIALYRRIGYEEVDRRGEGGFRRVFFVKQLVRDDSAR
jgi:GNAT superfamily N-acetyltransferase